MNIITDDTTILDLSAFSVEELKRLEEQSAAQIRRYKARIKFVQFAKSIAFARESIQRARLNARELAV
jgi:hypothetical protein